MTPTSFGTGAHAWKVGRGECRLLSHLYRRPHCLMSRRGTARRLGNNAMHVSDVETSAGAYALLRRDGATVDTADTGHRALALLQERRYDVLLCDLRMPELDGPAFYAILMRQY